MFLIQKGDKDEAHEWLKNNIARSDNMSMSNGLDNQGGILSSGETTETTEDGKKIKQLQQQLADSKKELDETKSLLVCARANEQRDLSSSSDAMTPTCMTKPSIINNHKITDAPNEKIYKELKIHCGLCALLIKKKQQRWCAYETKNNTHDVPIKGKKQ